ncbi:HAMP domain-containing histidine kinase [Geoalkalibacter halelectricus]|uniref:histidine kinase n=1 Tax=Geoalkalibacter halelectricus TaxID=2847045 RepID=A0ABY5ZNG3_9BACT|nr:HAMP domain-containing sensor histidine kinase [Geoalkalibacter halelectricus]UWZ80394.1 HAMP domain-containing histidine kinase [Geoalkalibacter halelectricus]
MQNLTGQRKFFSSFRTRLLAAATLGILCLALTAALTTAWVSGNRAQAQMIAQGIQVTDTLAGQSALALLFASRENAEKPLSAIMGFPNVDYAGIFDPNGEALLVVGSDYASLPRARVGTREAGAVLARETAFAWHFVAPVYTGATTEMSDPLDSPFDLGPPPKELLGFAYVAMNKRALHALNMNIFINNLVIGLSFAGVIVLILNIGIKRLLRPLDQLSALMREAERNNAYVLADLKGPEEITHMAGVYNRMMTSLEERDRRLRRHQAVLQTEVALRTRELVQARDAALNASRYKSEFLSNISHELRTPLQAIIGYADVVREDLELEGMEESARELGRVIHNAKRLLNLINDILLLAKAEAGRMELRMQVVDLRALAREAAETIQPLMQQNGNHLDVELRVEQDIEIDREKLLQAILNLLSNAAKFTNQGTVTLEMEQKLHLLKISVADTGIGLTLEQQRIIFEEFRQVDGSYTRKFQGTGLGLTITRRFCELMGGGIQVQSEPGSGSVFTIEIPLPVCVDRGEESASRAQGEFSFEFKPGRDQDLLPENQGGA